MYRGKTLFICDKCHKKFLAGDFEWSCTAFSVPAPCPECGSRHTLPFSAFFQKRVYKQIWESMDREAADNGGSGTIVIE